MTRSPDSSGSASDSDPSMVLIVAVVSTTEGAASRATATSRGSERSIRSGSGGHADTATAPAYRQPKNAAMKPMPGG
jgi:hypothetical protein